MQLNNAVSLPPFVYLLFPAAALRVRDTCHSICGLFELDAAVPDHLADLVDFGLHETVKFLGR